MLPPEAVKVPDKLLVPPTRTLLKPSEVGLALSEVEAATPVPVSGTRVGLFEALLTKEICPKALPAEVGANFAV